LVLPDNNHNNDRKGLGRGGNHKQRRKEEFELATSSSNYKRILIVDDEPNIAMTLKLGLESSNDRSEGP
jgi:hypothetical protein